jgi:hypothetical protein
MNSITHSSGFDLAQPVERVFPLFSPEGERGWVPGWDYVNVMGTTELSEDYIFLTKSHDHAATDAIWLVKRYDPARWLVQYYRVEPGDKVGIVTVQCARNGGRLTHVEVSYQYIALSESGQDFLMGFTSEFFEHFIGHWEQLLLEYFETAA